MKVLLVFLSISVAVGAFADPHGSAGNGIKPKASIELSKGGAGNKASDLGAGGGGPKQIDGGANGRINRNAGGGAGN